MYLYIVLIIFLLIIGCDKNQEKSVLEGVWKSHRELTISNFTDNEKLTDERRKFLENNLGKLYVSFKGNKARVFFHDISEDGVETQTFKVISNTESYIEIKIWYSQFDIDVQKYYKSDECLYIVQEEYGYNEYFCKLGDT